MTHSKKGAQLHPFHLFTTMSRKKKCIVYNILYTSQILIETAKNQIYENRRQYSKTIFQIYNVMPHVSLKCYDLSLINKLIV